MGKGDRLLLYSGSVIKGAFWVSQLGLDLVRGSALPGLVMESAPTWHQEHVGLPVLAAFPQRSRGSVPKGPHRGLLTVSGSLLDGETKSSCLCLKHLFVVCRHSLKFLFFPL